MQKRHNTKSLSPISCICMWCESSGIEPDFPVVFVLEWLFGWLRSRFYSRTSEVTAIACEPNPVACAFFYIAEGAMPTFNQRFDLLKMVNPSSGKFRDRSLKDASLFAFITWSLRLSISRNVSEST